MTDTENTPSCDYNTYDRSGRHLGTCALPATVSFTPNGTTDRIGYRCNAHAIPLSGSTNPARLDGRRAIPAADIEQLIGNAEVELDDVGRSPELVLLDLLHRLYALAGLEVPEHAYGLKPFQPMTIGHRDRCLLTLPHSTDLCGKPSAHRGR